MSRNGKQAGDPAKAAHRIFEAVTKTGLLEGKKEWLRLPLGKDVGQTTREKVKNVAEMMDDLEEVWTSIDFEEGK